MSQFSPFQTVNPRRPVRILQILFTILAVAFLLLGSVELSLTWLGDKSGNLFSISWTTTGDLEGKFLVTIFLLLLTVPVVWLLSTIALLLARRWIAAVLAVPLALGIFIGLYLFLVFVMPHVPSILFVVLLLLLNGGALWFAWAFLTSTNSGTRHPSPPGLN